jgi:O-antigen ligase
LINTDRSNVIAKYLSIFLLYYISIIILFNNLFKSTPLRDSLFSLPNSFIDRLDQLFTASILILSIFLMLFVFPNIKNNKTKYFNALIVSYLINSLAIITSCFLGIFPGFIDNTVFIPFSILAVIFALPNNESIILNTFKKIFTLFTLGSLALLIINPNWAFIKMYSILPGIDRRLFGLSSHPNSLGFIAGFLFILEAYRPNRNRFISIIILITSGIVIILCQSKTTWLCLLSLLLFTNPTLSKSILLQRIINLFRILVIFLFIIVSFFYGDQLITILSKSEYSNLSGRTIIWQDSVSSYKTDTIFGYGPQVFSMNDSKERTLGNTHNQFIQTLIENGILGIICLVVFLGTLVVTAVRVNKQTNGFSISIIVYFLLRLTTESPLRILSFNTEFLLLLLVLSLQVIWKFPNQIPNNIKDHNLVTTKY